MRSHSCSGAGCSTVSNCLESSLSRRVLPCYKWDCCKNGKCCVKPSPGAACQRAGGAGVCDASGFCIEYLGELLLSHRCCNFICSSLENHCCSGLRSTPWCTHLCVSFCGPLCAAGPCGRNCSDTSGSAYSSQYECLDGFCNSGMRQCQFKPKPAGAKCDMGLGTCDGKGKCSHGRTAAAAGKLLPD